MNADIQQYKLRFLTFALLLGYTYLHLSLTGQYINASFEDLTQFTAHLPFAQRLLTPLMARFIRAIFPLPFFSVYLLIEFLFISLFYLSLNKLLRLEFLAKQAQLLSWLFLLLLPLVTVINYRFNVGGIAMFYYPSDTASLFFITLGFYFCLREQWYALVFTIFVATFNRESSILLVLLIPALHWQKKESIYFPFLFSLLAYILARIMIAIWVFHLPGSFVEWYHASSSISLFRYNWDWLFKKEQILLFIYCFAALPFFWFTFYDFIPPQYRPLRYVLLFYFLGLLCVGIFQESRIFQEIVVLFYLPVCVSVRQWLLNAPFPLPAASLKHYFFRYSVIIILVLILLGQNYLNA